MFRGKYSSRMKVEKGSGTIRINQQIEESDSLTKNEELKQSGALEIRDEENTKSEIEMKTALRHKSIWQEILMKRKNEMKKALKMIILQQRFYIPRG